jgi:hypothetical protein
MPFRVWKKYLQLSCAADVYICPSFDRRLGHIPYQVRDKRGHVPPTKYLQLEPGDADNDGDSR